MTATIPVVGAFPPATDPVAARLLQRTGDPSERFRFELAVGSRRRGAIRRRRKHRPVDRRLDVERQPRTTGPHDSSTADWDYARGHDVQSTRHDARANGATGHDTGTHRSARYHACANRSARHHTFATDPPDTTPSPRDPPDTTPAATDQPADNASGSTSTDETQADESAPPGRPTNPDFGDPCVVDDPLFSALRRCSVRAQDVAIGPSWRGRVVIAGITEAEELLRRVRSDPHDEVTTAISSPGGCGKSALLSASLTAIAAAGIPVWEVRSAPSATATRGRPVLVDNAHLAATSILDRVEQLVTATEARVFVAFRPWPHRPELRRLTEAIRHRGQVLHLRHLHRQEVARRVAATLSVVPVTRSSTCWSPRRAACRC